MDSLHFRPVTAVFKSIFTAWNGLTFVHEMFFRKRAMQIDRNQPVNYDFVRITESLNIDWMSDDDNALMRIFFTFMSLSFPCRTDRDQTTLLLPVTYETRNCHFTINHRCG